MRDDIEVMEHVEVEMKEPYNMLTAVYMNLTEIHHTWTEADKWLKICSEPKLYTGMETYSI